MGVLYSDWTRENLTTMNTAEGQNDGPNQVKPWTK